MQLPFLISCRSIEHVQLNPTIFALEKCEYDNCIDSLLTQVLVNFTSEMVVTARDTNWQFVVKTVCGLDILVDQHDPSSQMRCRPDFIAMFNNMLIMKAEAKVTSIDMFANAKELTNKLHATAFKSFPVGSNSIPALMTSIERIALYSLNYNLGKFEVVLVKSYDMMIYSERVQFCVDLIKICIWIVSQTNPNEHTHLSVGTRTKTRNGHHVTLIGTGLLKEFSVHKMPSNDTFELFRTIYSSSFENVEHGTVNCTSVMITRIGSRLRDAMRNRGLTVTQVCNQVKAGLDQLHSINIAHCDLCVDNVFVDDEVDGGKVFLGDLEYVQDMNKPPRLDLRRSDINALTARQLDDIQFENFVEECAKLI